MAIVSSTETYLANKVLTRALFNLGMLWVLLYMQLLPFKNYFEDISVIIANHCFLMEYLN